VFTALYPQLAFTAFDDSIENENQFESYLSEASDEATQFIDQLGPLATTQPIEARVVENP
jgi:hypothetical protein